MSFPYVQKILVQYLIFKELLYYTLKNYYYTIELSYYGA